MLPRSNPHGRTSAAAFAVLVSLATLAGCSSRPSDVLAPSQSSAELAAGVRTSPILATPSLPPIEGWEGPRIRVWTDDGWRVFQKESGISLAPDRIHDLDLSSGGSVTFHWSAHPKTGRADIVGTRWTLDLDDITDETPRSGPDDLAHWSQWSADVTSASVGPFITGPDTLSHHFFHVEARDNLGFVTLFPVRIRVHPSTEAGLARRR